MAALVEKKIGGLFLTNPSTVYNTVQVAAVAFDFSNLAAELREQVEQAMEDSAEDF